MDGGESVAKVQLSQRESRLDRFDHERADVFSGRRGLGSEALFGGRGRVIVMAMGGLRNGLENPCVSYIRIRPIAIKREKSASDHSHGGCRPRRRIGTRGGRDPEPRPVWRSAHAGMTHDDGENVEKSITRVTAMT